MIALTNPIDRQRLRMARRRAGLSQRDVAAFLDISRTAYQRFESGLGALDVDAWKRLQQRLGLTAEHDRLDSSVAPSDVAALLVGQRITAARRRHGWSRRRLAAALRPIDPSWTVGRFRRLETGTDRWPVAGCLALANLLQLHPGDVGLGDLPTILTALHPLVWTVFYERPSDLRAVSAAMQYDPSPLVQTIEGLWTLQALGVAMRDLGHFDQAWALLELAERHAALFANAPDVQAAAAMRLARAAYDAAAMATPAAAQAWRIRAQEWIRRAQVHERRCRPPLRAMIALTAAEVQATTAPGSLQAFESAIALAERVAGRDAISGVVVHPIGALHLQVRTALAWTDWSSAQRPVMQASVKRLEDALQDSALPHRWRADMLLTLAQARARFGHVDHAAALVDAAVILTASAGSVKHRRRLQRMIDQWPDSRQRGEWMDALNALAE